MKAGFPMASYEQSTASKLWSVRFRITGVDGTQINKRLSGFRTKRDAQQGYLKWIENDKKAAEERALASAPLSAADMLFCDMAEKYLAFLAGRSKESSTYDIQSRIKNRLLPFFGNKSMKDITPSLILEWQLQITKEYSYKYVDNIRSSLSSILNYAERYYDIPSPIKRVDKMRNMEPKAEMQFWTPDEFAAFLSEVKTQLWQVYFLTLYITGARRGEIEALGWNDVDTVKGTITISKSITHKTSGHAWEITTPKNASSNRTVDLPSWLCLELDKWREEQKEIARSKNLSPLDLRFVFGGERPVARTSADRIFNAAISASNVKKIRIHDLRHSCASLLISGSPDKGRVSIVGISRRLGHSNIEQTLNTYAHMMPDDVKVSLGILDDLAPKFSFLH